MCSVFKISVLSFRSRIIVTFMERDNILSATYLPAVFGCTALNYSQKIATSCFAAYEVGLHTVQEKTDNLLRSFY